MNQDVFIMDLLWAQGYHLCQAHTSIKEHCQHRAIAKLKITLAIEVVQQPSDFIFAESQYLGLGLFHILDLGSWVLLDVPLSFQVVKEMIFTPISHLRGMLQHRASIPNNPYHDQHILEFGMYQRCWLDVGI